MSGNRTRVSRVTGEDTNHYTNTDLLTSPQPNWRYNLPNNMPVHSTAATFSPPPSPFRSPIKPNLSENETKYWGLESGWFWGSVGDEEVGEILHCSNPYIYHFAQSASLNQSKYTKTKQISILWLQVSSKCVILIRGGRIIKSQQSVFFILISIAKSFKNICLLIS